MFHSFNLFKVEESWKSTEFIVLPYKDSKDVFIIGGTDEIQQLWDDSNINISTIASSRHVGPIKHRVDEWQTLLELFGRTLVIQIRIYLLMKSVMYKMNFDTTESGYKS